MRGNPIVSYSALENAVLGLFVVAPLGLVAWSGLKRSLRRSGGRSWGLEWLRWRTKRPHPSHHWFQDVIPEGDFWSRTDFDWAMIKWRLRRPRRP